jgi:hypothetical protein
MQQGIDAALTEAEGFLCPRLDRLHDFVAVHLPLGQEPEEHEFGDSVKKDGIGSLQWNPSIPLGSRHVNLKPKGIVIVPVDNDPADAKGLWLQVRSLLFSVAVDLDETAYVFRCSDGGKVAVTGERLDWMHAESERLGITLEELWRMLVGSDGDRIWRCLEMH